MTIPLERAVFRILAFDPEFKERSGTAWFFTQDLLLTAAHCVGDREQRRVFGGPFTLLLPGTKNPPHLELVHDPDWDLDVALLRLPPGTSLHPAPIPLPLGKLPNDLEPGEVWRGRGFPRAHREGLHPFGSISSLAGRVENQPAIELSCEYGGQGNLEGISGGPVCVAGAAVATLRYAPPQTNQLVIHATALAQVGWAELQGLLQPVSLEPPPPPLGPEWLTPAPTRYFTGRKDELRRLHESMRQLGERTAAAPSLGPGRQPALQAICGVSGVGKTELAKAYAALHGKEYQAVYWLEFRNLASTRTALAALRPHLARHQPWLLVIDGADPPEPLGPLLNGIEPGGQVLITTEDEDSTALGITAPIALDVFKEDEALDFLLHRAARPARPFSEVEKQSAQQLAELLEYDPFDLEIAGAAVARGGTTFAMYCRMVKAQPAGSRNLDLRIKQCEASGKHVLSLLQAAALLGKEPIPLAFFESTTCRPLFGETIALPRLHEAAEQLRGASLIRYEDDTISVKPRTQGRMTEMMGEPQARDSLRVLCAAARQHLSAPQTDLGLCLQLVPHLRHLVRQVERYRLPSDDAAALLQQASATLLGLDQLDHAEPFLQSHAKLKRELFQQAELALVSVLSDLGLVQHQRGRREEARTCFQRALQLCQASEGEVATSQAEVLYRKVLGCVKGLDYPLEQTSALSGLVRVLCRLGQDLAASRAIRELTTGLPD